MKWPLLAVNAYARSFIWHGRARIGELRLTLRTSATLDKNLARARHPVGCRLALSIERKRGTQNECQPPGLNEVKIATGGTTNVPGPKSMKQRDTCTEDPRGVDPLGAGTQPTINKKRVRSTLKHSGREDRLGGGQAGTKRGRPGSRDAGTHYCIKQDCTFAVKTRPRRGAQRQGGERPTAVRVRRHLEGRHAAGCPKKMRERKHLKRCLRRLSPNGGAAKPARKKRT